MAADRHLLFGLLALQTGLIQQAQLVAAFHAWTCDKARSLADHLLALGHLNAAQRAAVEALAALHIEAHGGAVERSLAAVPAERSTRQSLANLADPDIQATLGQVGSGRGSTVLDGHVDADRTADYSVGTATSNGQRFRVLRPHARGNLGAVFVALDQELNREVALKQILDNHADDPTSRARFLLEAEVTGGLEHPGIVPVYGLGTYGQGRPFYAMRFIRGDSLKEAIDRFHSDGTHKENPGQRSLELRKLLRRFNDVCNAIDYAHSRGVLHRDIKPANIIVGKYGETLVVDWGLAKVTGKSEPGAGEQTLVPSSSSGSSETLPGSALGTPAYMSPEQARGELEQLGSRSDVYSLGATLYCLLCGKPPQEGNDVGELLRRSQRGEFPHPTQLDPSIDPALEAVCLKAMALEPRDRYASPRVLVEDIESWMADEPVTAWREPWTRRVLRWLTRHRTGVTAAAAAVLVGVVGLCTVLTVQSAANAELKRSNTELATANQKVTQANTDLRDANEREIQRFDLALEAIKLFHSNVTEDLLLKEKQFQGLRSKLLKGAADFYGKLERALQGQGDSLSRAALGRAYFEMGRLTSEIGTYAAAVAEHRKGLAVRRELAERPGADAETVLDVVRSLLELGTMLASSGDYARAQVSFEEAPKLAEGLVAAGRGGDDARSLLALSLVAASFKAANPKDALEMVSRGRAIAHELVRKYPKAPLYLERLGDSHYANGYVLRDRLGLPAEAIVAVKEAASIYQRLGNAQPDVYRFQNQLAKQHSYVAFPQIELGRFDEAITSLRQAVAIGRKAADANPAVTSLANNLASGLNQLAWCLIQTGRPAKALETLAQVRPIVRKLLEVDPGSFPYLRKLATSYSFAGQALARLGRRREAEDAFDDAVSIWQKLVDEHPSDERNQGNLASTFGEIGWTLWTAGWSADALTAYGREREIRQRLAAARPTNTLYSDALASCETSTAAALFALGRLSEARAACERAIAIREELVKADPEDDDYAQQGLEEGLIRSIRMTYAQGLAESLMRSGSVKAATGDIAGAAALWRRAETLYASRPCGGQSAIFLACCHGALAGLAGKENSGVSAAEGTSRAEKAMDILHKTFADGYRAPDFLRVEPGLDTLRSRPDFQLLMMDLAFPVDPFARGG
jgi:eukaryotic-like serine/threonine-protein kinase